MKVIGYCGGQHVLRTGEDRKVVLDSNGQPQVYIEAPIRCITCGPLPETRSAVLEGQPDADWETDAIATYVVTFETDDGEGACDVQVRVGEGRASLRSSANVSAALTASSRVPYAVSSQSSFPPASSDVWRYHWRPADAEDYVARKLRETAGEPCADGEFCVYWETSLRERVAAAWLADVASVVGHYRSSLDALDQQYADHAARWAVDVQRIAKKFRRASVLAWVDDDVSMGRVVVPDGAPKYWFGGYSAPVPTWWMPLPQPPPLPKARNS